MTINTNTLLTVQVIQMGFDIAQFIPLFVAGAIYFISLFIYNTRKQRTE